MLRRTFCHIPEIGYRTERALWAQGCDSWDTFLAEPGRYSTGTADRMNVSHCVEMSAWALDTMSHQYFATSLNACDTWRAWPEFRDSCVYLDIETDGGRTGQAITTIGLYDGAGFRCLVQGQDLDTFRDVISHYRMVVTFFGTGFDLPLLKKRFCGQWFDQIHIDLCPTLRQLGLKGGLKRIEKELGISRGEHTDGLSGRDAIYLWQSYRFGSDEALKTLIAYNREDVVNLEVLAQFAYDRLSARLLAGA